MTHIVRTEFMHNGQLVSLDNDTLIGIQHDDHFNPDAEPFNVMVDKALAAEKLTFTP